MFVTLKYAMSPCSAPVTASNSLKYLSLLSMLLTFVFPTYNTQINLIINGILHKRAKQLRKFTIENLVISLVAILREDLLCRSSTKNITTANHKYYIK